MRYKEYKKNTGIEVLTKEIARKRQHGGRGGGGNKIFPQNIKNITP